MSKGAEGSKADPDKQPNGATHGSGGGTHANGALGKGDGWLRSVLENASENVTRVDPDGVLRYASPAFGRMLGHDPAQVGGIVVQTRDVTDRKEAEEALRSSEEALKESEQRYRTLLERVPAILYIQRPRKGETAARDTPYISPRVEEVLGYPPQRFTEDPDFWDKVIHPEDLGAVKEEDERTDRTGEPFSMEYRMIDEDGRHVWVRDEATLVRDDAGEPLYWPGREADLTG